MAINRRSAIFTAAILTYFTASATYDARQANRDPLYRWAWVAVIAPVSITCLLSISRSEEDVRRRAGLTFLAALIPATVLTVMGRLHAEGNSFHFWMNCIVFGLLLIVCLSTAPWRKPNPVSPAKPTQEP